MLPWIARRPIDRQRRALAWPPQTRQNEYVVESMHSCQVRDSWRICSLISEAVTAATGKRRMFAHAMMGLRAWTSRTLHAAIGPACQLDKSKTFNVDGNWLGSVFF
ncbi:hypothetical protein PspLS_02202, partial [Pyricularia sp. CBS 133598]